MANASGPPPILEISAEIISERIVCSRSTLIRVAGFDGGSSLFIRGKPLLVRCADELWQTVEPTAKLLQSRDHEHDFALRRMGLKMCKKLAGSATAELLKLFCQLSCDAKLPLRHQINTSGECFC
jgi:hypothetical protein